MKKLNYLFISLLIISLASCEKADQEIPGNIPGMGNTPGELIVEEAYNFPQGVVLISQITGLNDDLSGYSVRDKQC